MSIYLPDWVAPRQKAEKIARVKASRIPKPREINLPVAGESALIPEAFGRCMMSNPRVFAVAEVNNTVILGLLWAYGEIDQVNNFYVGNELFTGTVTHYVGTAGQTADATLAGAIAGYADDLANLFYSVVTLTETTLQSARSFAIDFNGRKLYDPRTLTTIATNNPALMYRHVADQAGLTVDDTSIGTAADYCEEDVGGYPRWACGLVFDQPASIDSQLSLIAEYAGCFHVREAGSVKLIPDTTTATTNTFSDDTADINAGAGMIVANSLRLTKKSLDQLPNQALVQFSDPSKYPWRQPWAETSLPAGDLRQTEFRMVGFRDYNTAYRFAVERQNRFNLVDLLLEFTAFDEGLPVEKGDAIEVTHSVGLTDKAMRVIDVQTGNEPGRWNISTEEYDPAVYSDDTSAEPTYPDITLPDPADVPVGPTATVTEVLFTDQTGHTYTRFNIAFSGVSWLFVSNYRIQVAAGSTVILEQTIAHQGAGVAHTTVTSATSQDVEYTIKIWVVNVFAKVGATPSSATKTGNGKILPPTDVAGMVGYEAGQFVNLDWTDAADTDLLGYEVRRLTSTLYEAAPSTAWDHASTVLMVERVDASRVLLPSQPVGLYYYMVKARDIAGNESLNATAVRVSVTSDYAGQQVIEELLDDTLTNMHAFELHGISGGRFATSSGGEAFSDKFAAGEAFSDVYAADETWIADETLASSMESAEWDTGADRQGNWNWTASVVSLGGTITYTTSIAKDADYPTFSDSSGQSINTGARYMMVKAEVASALGNGFTIELPVLATHQGKILEQVIESSVLATGQPLAVAFPTAYASAPEVTPRYQGSNPYFAVVDSITSTGFNLYLWDTAGDPVAGTVRSTAIGT